MLAVAMVAALVVSLMCVIMLSGKLRGARLVPDGPGASKPASLLLLIAHPDDEAMFFVPTLVAAAQVLYHVPLTSVAEHLEFTMPFVCTSSSRHAPDNSPNVARRAEGSHVTNIQEYTVYVLCISNGDYEGLGKTREEELRKSCSLLQMYVFACVRAGSGRV
jgi:hypothetical protein